MLIMSLRRLLSEWGRRKRRKRGCWMHGAGAEQVIASELEAFERLLFNLQEEQEEQESPQSDLPPCISVYLTHRPHPGIRLYIYSCVSRGGGRGLFESC